MCIRDRTRGLPANVVYVADGERPVDAAVLGAAVGRLTGLMLLAPSASSAAAQSRLTALGVEPAVDRVVSARGVGGTDPTVPALPAPVQPPAGLPLTPPAVDPPLLPPPVVVTPTRRSGRLSATVTPARELRAPFSFRTRGTLTLPSAITKLVGCIGRVSVQVKRGNVTISTRRVTLSKSCTYSSRVTFANSRRFGRTIKRLKFTARFLGNARVLPTAATPRYSRIRR